MTVPVVAERVARGEFELHGIGKDIRDGSLEIYDPATGAFAPL
jgi:hypothetical protein